MYFSSVRDSGARLAKNFARVRSNGAETPNGKNGLAHAELVGVMDSIRGLRRAQGDVRTNASEPAFAASLAVD